MKALIIVDIQNDFMPGGALAVPEGDQIISIINNIIPKFDAVVATQDWHPKDHKSFASQHQGKAIFDNINLEGLSQTLWPDHCIQNTTGAAFHPELKQDGIHAIFRKGMISNLDSYSGFYDNAHRNTTGLHGYLKDREVTEVYVCGLSKDYCVYFTALDSIANGYKTYIISDAAMPISWNDWELKKEHYKSIGGLMIQSSEL